MISYLYTKLDNHTPPLVTAANDSIIPGRTGTRCHVASSWGILAPVQVFETCFFDFIDLVLHFQQCNVMYP